MRVANSVSASTTTVPPPLKRLMSGTPAAAAAASCTSSPGFLHGNARVTRVHSSSSGLRVSAWAPRTPGDAQHHGWRGAAIVQNAPVAGICPQQRLLQAQLLQDWQAPQPQQAD